MSSARLLFVAVASTVQLLGNARAEGSGELDRAEAAIESVEYEKAERLAAEALASGTLTPAEIARAWRLRGIVLASLGRGDEATNAFVELLSADPSATLEPGLPPRVLTAFETAQSRAPGAVRVHCQLDLDSQTLSIELDPGGSSEVRYVLVERKVGGALRRDRVSAPLRLALPGEKQEISCYAVDDSGNLWLSGPGREAPLSWTPKSAAPPPSIETGGETAASPELGVWRSPWLWGAASLSALGVATGFAIAAERDQDRLDKISGTTREHEFGRAADLLERGESRARVANIAFVVGGALAAITIYTLWTRPESSTESGDVSLRVGPGGLQVRGSF